MRLIICSNPSKRSAARNIKSGARKAWANWFSCGRIGKSASRDWNLRRNCSQKFYRTDSDSLARRDFTRSRQRSCGNRRRRRTSAHYKSARQKIHHQFSLKRHRSAAWAKQICQTFARRVGQSGNDCANQSARGRNVSCFAQKWTRTFVKPSAIADFAWEIAKTLKFALFVCTFLRKLGTSRQRRQTI